MRALILAILSIFSSASAWAVVDVQYNGNTRTYTFPSGTIGASPSVYEYAFPNSSSSHKPSIQGGSLVIDTANRLPIADGRTVDVVARRIPNKPDVAKAVGTFARGIGGAALKTAGAVYAAAEVAKALNDLCNELGYSCYKGADGQPTVSKPDPAGCPTSAGCTMYYVNSSWSAPTNGPARSSQSAACTAFGAVNGVSTSLVLASGQYSCIWHKPGQQYSDGSMVRSYQAGPAPIVPLPSSIQELEDKIASESGWPSSSSLPKVIEQAIASGQTLPVPTPSQITGPTSIPGETKRETTPAQNGQPAQTKTTTTNYNVTYSPNTVTNNQTTTTVINNGTTVTTTTEETQPEPAPSDTANPDLPKLYTRKYPDGLTGVWTTRKAELMATPLPKLIQAFSPTIVSTNGCPQFSIPLNLGQWNWGTYSLGPACYVWDFLRVCVILGAMFMARALVFGG